MFSSLDLCVCLLALLCAHRVHADRRPHPLGKPMERLWQHGCTGKHVKVAILDSGIGPKHYRYGNIITTEDFTDDESTLDFSTHGSAVAGLIGSATHGTCPDCDVYVLKIFNRHGMTKTAWILDALNYALHVGVQVINLSYGTRHEGDAILLDKLAHLADKGVLVVAAIGNGGPLPGTTHLPAKWPHVLSVGSLEHTASTEMTEWTSRGPGLPEVSTPGVNVYTLAPLQGTLHHTGTSISTPLVAGVAACLLSCFPESSAQAIRHALVHTRLPRSHALQPMGAFQFLLEHTHEQQMADMHVENTALSTQVSVHPRRRRILWDLGHQRWYPVHGYYASDTLMHTVEPVEMDMDSPETNYAQFVADHLSSYAIQTTNKSLDAFDCTQYGLLFLVDIEAPLTVQETAHITKCVRDHGLGLVILAGWSSAVIAEGRAVEDKETGDIMTPLQDGACAVGSLNNLANIDGISIRHTVVDVPEFGIRAGTTLHVAKEEDTMVAKGNVCHNLKTGKKQTHNCIVAAWTSRVFVSGTAQPLAVGKMTAFLNAVRAF